MAAGFGKNVLEGWKWRSLWGWRVLRSLVARLSLSEILEHHLGMPGRWAQETCIHGEALGSVLCDAFRMGARLEVMTETAQGE